MKQRIEQIEANPNLSRAEKVRQIEAQLADVRARADDPELPLESQQGDMMIAAEGALLRLKSEE